MTHYITLVLASSDQKKLGEAFGAVRALFPMATGEDANDNGAVEISGAAVDANLMLTLDCIERVNDNNLLDVYDRSETISELIGANTQAEMERILAEVDMTLIDTTSTSPAAGSAASDPTPDGSDTTSDGG